MWSDFLLLFAEMNAISAICLILGLVFVVAEIFQPGFGFFGITGLVLLIIGIVVRVVNYGTANPMNLFFILVLIILIVLVIAFLIMLRSARKGLLAKSPIIEQSTAVPTGITEGTRDFSNLVGMIGVAKTALRPGGIVVINDVQYDVVSAGFFLDAGTTVKVEMVEGVKIVVREVKL